MEAITLNNYKKWLDSDAVSFEDKEILRKMSEEEIDDAFFKKISFGTAGMRGVLGPGTNRMNVYTIKKACVGYGLYLLETFKDNVSCAISHDNRFMSREFTLECSEILNQMGIDTYIFDSLRPTPELSYAVRYQKCSGGIMITASHNPKSDNGFKVYDETGCQLVPNKIERLIEIIAELPEELLVEVPKSTKKAGICRVFDKKLDDSYVELCKTVQLHPELDKRNFKIVFTPNHGASYVNAMRVFKECGYEIYPVLSQCTPDPAFSGTLSPNPENDDSYIEAIKLAKKIDADMICMTDPDGDRVGIAVRNRKGEFVRITGNEGGALLIEYILRTKKERGELTGNEIMYDTVVTSNLGREIAKNYGVKVESLLTGFKFIGDRIAHYEKLKDSPKFVFGYEESYGCLIKDFARDKDGTQAILLYCEMALWNKHNGLTLDEAYEKLCEKYGFYKARGLSIYFKGSTGQAKMEELLKELLAKPFKELLGVKVKYFENYVDLTRKDFLNGTSEKISNIPSNLLIKYIFENNSSIAIRPSGTEPKCKFYVEVCGTSLKEADENCAKYYEALREKYGF